MKQFLQAYVQYKAGSTISVEGNTFTEHTLVKLEIKSDAKYVSNVVHSNYTLSYYKPL